MSLCQILLTLQNSAPTQQYARRKGGANQAGYYFMQKGQAELKLCLSFLYSASKRSFVV